MPDPKAPGGGPPPLVEYGGGLPLSDTGRKKSGSDEDSTRTTGHGPGIKGGYPLLMLRSEGVAVPAPEKWEGGEGGSRFFKGGGTPLPHCSQKTVSAA
jgi:hypothetical protein